MIWFPQSMLQSANPILFHEFVDEVDLIPKLVIYTQSTLH